MRTSGRLAWLSVMALGVGIGAAACKGKKQLAAGEGPTSAGDTGQATTVALTHYMGNADSARMGRGYFIKYNCYGCHGGLAGGAMGPSLRDTIWKYGGSDSSIALSIAQGRPLGMPTWQGIIPPEQIRLLVDYIKSLRTDAEPKFFFVQLDSNGTVVLPVGNGVSATVAAGGATQ
jgi:cytochrome c oxidase cbb3-type subunit 3